jgi:Gas vesicle synthesis protein GvpL/GvpF
MNDDLTRMARAAAPDVLAAALDRAREQAAARLADLLTEAIVAEALAVGVPSPAAPGPAVPEPAPAPLDGGRHESLYAYGITLADLALPEEVPSLTGGPGVGRIAAGELALLVSPVTSDQLRVDEDDLSESGRLATLARGHDAVVRAAAATGPVLPLRFGTVVPDESAAHQLLAEHADSALRQLRRIGAAREWGVKLVRRLGEPAPVGSRPADRADVTGTEYLARRRQALHADDAAARAAQHGADLVEEALRPHAGDCLRRGGSPGSSLLLDLALLVAPEQEEAFLAAAAELGERLEPDGLAVEVSGPWPPYSFATLEAGHA